MNKRIKIKGSAILVVIFCAISFYIYTMSTYAQIEHFSIVQDRYEKSIKKGYEKDEKEFYDRIVEKKTLNNF